MDTQSIVNQILESLARSLNPFQGFDKAKSQSVNPIVKKRAFSPKFKYYLNGKPATASECEKAIRKELISIGAWKDAYDKWGFYPLRKKASYKGQATFKCNGLEVKCVK